MKPVYGFQLPAVRHDLAGVMVYVNVHLATSQVETFACSRAGVALGTKLQRFRAVVWAYLLPDGRPLFVRDFGFGVHRTAISFFTLN